MINRRVILARRPSGLPTSQDLVLDEVTTPILQDGQFLVRNHYASLDPAMRGWMDDAPSYLPPIALGSPLRSSTVGVVVESRNADFPVGQWVTGGNAIEEYSLCVVNEFLRKIDERAAPKITNYLSVLGINGLTAYFGLGVAEPRAGETVLVSAAAGSVGSLVGQIAKIKGCRTVGIAGGPSKCARLINDYKYDAAIDYRGKSLAELHDAIAAACPQGVDVHFENVGGTILDAALMSINARARIVICGLISQYNSEPKPISNLWPLIVHGARIQGFIMTHYRDRAGEALPHLMEWLRSGQLRVDEHIDEGIENALPALLRLFEGTNQGKMILKLI